MLGKIGIGAAAVLVLLAIAFYIRADIFCSRSSAEGPTVAGTILISGCRK
jgi:hypothetical protein